jgi:hypothetical protein
MSNNTKYGVSSLNSNKGSDNTAVGAYSAYTNLDGDKNTAIGSNSSFYNTSGSNNTALGAGSLCNNTTGSLNTAIGSSALEGEPNVIQSVGDQNVAVGAQALYTNSGDLNTAIGTSSGIYAGSGSYNTFLGADTDVDSDSTLNYSTAIGYNAKIDDSNQIMMGGSNLDGDYPNVMIPGKGYLPNFDITDPDIANDQIVTKQYVDSVGQGLAPKAPCLCIANYDVTITDSTGQPATLDVNATFTSLFIIDGVQTYYSSSDPIRVLINNQSTTNSGNAAAVDNGIYTIESDGQSPPTYSWARTSDMQDGDDALGAFCFVKKGNTYQTTSWIQSVKIDNNGSPVIIGHVPLLFIQYSSFNFQLGRGLSPYSSSGTIYVSVDTSLNFVNTLDSDPTASQPGGQTGATGTLTIGSNTDTTIITSSSDNPISFPVGLTSDTNITVNGVTVGRGTDNQYPVGTNTIFGYHALQNSTDYANTAIGYSALKNTQTILADTGVNNTAVGAAAMQDNTTGYDNTAVGSGALQLLQHGFNNTAIGQQALYNSNSSNSSNNTAVGYLAAYHDVSGYGNTYLGSNTDIDTESNTYSNSTAIGYNAKITASNQMVLGGSNYGDYPNVMIPGNLDVSGTSHFTGTMLVGPNSDKSFKVETTTSTSGTYPDYTGNSTITLSGSSDYGEIKFLAAVKDTGVLQISTGDNGTEPITFVQTNGSTSTERERMRIHSNGNVGINNSTPAYTLDVSGTIHVTNNLLVDGNTTLGNSLTDTSVVNGSLGINNTSPYYNLDVSGNSHFTGTMLVGSSASQYFKVETSTVSTGVYSSNLSGSATISLSGNNDYGQIQYIANNIDNGVLQISTGDNGNEPITFVQTNGSASTERMRIHSNGNVGINNSAPAYTLDVSGNANVGPVGTNSYTSQLSVHETTGTGPYTQASAGATPTPTAPTTGSLVITHNNSGGTSSILFPSTANSGSDYGYIQYFDNVGGSGEKGLLLIGIENDITSSNWDRISLYADQGNGYIGINTLNPLYNLDVSGNANISGYINSAGPYCCLTYSVGTDGTVPEAISGTAGNIYVTPNQTQTGTFLSNISIINNSLQLPTGYYGVYKVKFTVNVNNSGHSGESGYYRLKIYQSTVSDTSSTKYSNRIFDQSVASLSSYYSTTIESLFRYTNTNSGRYFLFQIENGFDFPLNIQTGDGNTGDISYGTIEINKVA